jgi:hypothetical protein
MSGGIPTFSRTADFSGMTDAEPLQISSVVHQSVVDVGETGTKAAAATGVIMKMCCTVVADPQPPIEFDADHPFLFAIRDTQSGSLLFMGQVTNPTQTEGDPSAPVITTPVHFQTPSDPSLPDPVVTPPLPDPVVAPPSSAPVVAPSPLNPVVDSGPSSSPIQTPMLPTASIAPLVNPSVVESLRPALEASRTDAPVAPAAVAATTPTAAAASAATNPLVSPGHTLAGQVSDSQTIVEQPGGNDLATFDFATDDAMLDDQRS